jgi:hypothetical protein
MMKASKFLVSALSTATIVGAIGFAYAQTSSDPATMDNSSVNNPAVAPSTSSSVIDNSSTAMEPRADRG